MALRGVRFFSLFASLTCDDATSSDLVRTSCSFKAFDFCECGTRVVRVLVCPLVFVL